MRACSWKRQRLVRVCIAATLALIGTPRAGRAASGGAHISNSPLGYLGCVQTEDGSRLFCVVAAHNAAGTRTDVSFYGLSTAAPWLVESQHNATVPLDALTVDGVGSATILKLETQLTGIGDVRLQVFTRGATVVTSQNDTCPIYPLHYEAYSPGGDLNPVWRVTGSVATSSVVEYGPTCTDSFTGRTSALWRVVGAG